MKKILVVEDNKDSLGVLGLFITKIERFSQPASGVLLETPFAISFLTVHFKQANALAFSFTNAIIAVAAPTQVQDETIFFSESLRKWPLSSQDSARHEAGLRGTPDRTR